MKPSADVERLASQMKALRDEQRTLPVLLGGAIGNLIDRVRLGRVVDFVDMGIGSFRWYAWNVADAAVFVGILCLFGAALLAERGSAARSEVGRPA